MSIKLKKKKGEQHNGFDDAKNIARILIKLANDGCKIDLNSRIKNPLTKIEKKISTTNEKLSESDDSEDENSTSEIEDEKVVCCTTSKKAN